MGVGSYGVCFGGSGEISPLVELLGVDCRAEIGSTIGMSDGNRDDKIEGYPPGEWAFG